MYATVEDRDADAATIVAEVPQVWRVYRGCSDIDCGGFQRAVGRDVSDLIIAGEDCQRSGGQGRGHALHDAEFGIYYAALSVDLSLVTGVQRVLELYDYLHRALMCLFIPKFWRQLARRLALRKHCQWNQ